MSKKHVDRKRMKDNATVGDQFTKELSAGKPVVKMSENFRIGLKNELLAEFAKRTAKKKVKSSAGGFFSGAWVKGFAGAMAVVVISVVTIYVNRAQFLPKETAPVISITEAVKEKSEGSIAENGPAPVKQRENQKNDKSLANAGVEKEEETVPSGGKDDFSAKGYESDRSMDARSKSAPAPESAFEPRAQTEKKLSARQERAAADEILSDGMAETSGIVRKPIAIVEYRFGGRPNAFEDIVNTLSQGRLPAKSQVNLDELANEFSIAVITKSAAPLSVKIESADSPWNKNELLFFLTVQALSTGGDALVAENAGLRIRFYEGSIAKLPAGSLTYLTVNDRAGKESGLSGEFRSGEMSSLMIAVPVAPGVSYGVVLAEVELFFKKPGSPTLEKIPFTLSYSGVAEAVSDRYRLASAATYWGKILLGSVPAESSRFAEIHRLLEKVGSKAAAADRKRLADAVDRTRKLMGK